MALAETPEQWARDPTIPGDPALAKAALAQGRILPRAMLLVWSLLAAALTWVPGAAQVVAGVQLADAALPAFTLAQPYETGIGATPPVSLASSTVASD